jgi:hypothetical protein
MSHTDEFNEIMKRTETAHRSKKAKQKIVPVPIEARENMNELQISIYKCKIAENTVFLPRADETPLHNYSDVRKAFLSAGASYKNNTFIFPSDAKPYIDRLMGGEKVNLKKEYQFFATPAELAKNLVYLADVKNHHTILEPSAGHGAIIKSIQAVCSVQIDYCELMDINKAILADISGTRCINSDFLKQIVGQKYDRIIANPPFSKNQDIDHVRHMYSHLKTGGRIVSIMSNSWRKGSQKKQEEFRQWLEDINAEVEEIEAGAFKESGTNISACIVIIDK